MSDPLVRQLDGPVANLSHFFSHGSWQIFTRDIGDGERANERSSFAICMWEIVVYYIHERDLPYMASVQKRCAKQRPNLQ